MKRLAPRFSCLAAILALAPACVESDPQPTVEARVLENFGSCDDLTSYAKQHARDSLEKYYAEILESAKKDPCFTSNDCSFPTDDGVGIPESDQSAEDDADTPNDGSDTPGTNTPGTDSGGKDNETPEHSTTNNQEAGVDEPDIVKTDGRRIVAVQGSQVHHIDATGPTPVLTGSLEIEGSWGGGEMFLVGDKVFLIDTASSGDMVPGTLKRDIAPDGYYLPVVRVHEIDLSDPAQPKLLRRIHMVGSYNGARMVGSVARLVLQSAPLGLTIVDPRQLYWESYPSGDSSEGSDPGTGETVPGTMGGGSTGSPATKRLRARPQAGDGKTNLQRLEEAIAQARTLNNQAIDATNVGNWLPSYTLEDFSTGSVQTSGGQLYDCTFGLRPGVHSGLDTLNIVTLDLTQPLQAPQGTGVFASGGVVYSGVESLYVATMPWSPIVPLSSGWPMTGGIAVDVAPSVDVAESVPGSVPQVGGVAQDGAIAFRAGEPEMVQTHIHKFAFEAPRTPQYGGSGAVGGYLLNQFAMSEHNGDLRVAATTMPSGWNWDPNWQSQSFVSVLRPGAEGLDEIGRVDGLGIGERIQSVRFDGDIGYVVTFRQTDPLYTIDLRNPAAPVKAGELKVEGFSAYLHPIGQNLVLGVGRDANSDGQVTGMQVSLFDVSNLAAPTRVANYTVADADSQVQWDHHAFLYWGAKNLAVIPVQSWGRWDETTMQQVGSFTGVYAFRVTSAAIEKIGEIAHPAIEYPQGDGETVPGGDPSEGDDLPPDGDTGDMDDTDPDQGDQVDPVDPGVSSYVPTLTRSLVIGEVLYTLSDGGLKGNALDGLAELSWVPFAQP